MFVSNSWTSEDGDARILSHRGYAVRKDCLTPAQTKQLKTALTVKPNVAATFATPEPFPIFYESPSRWYVPRFWGLEHCGSPDGDARGDGKPLRDELVFNKTLRSEQVPIVDAFLAGDANGLICVPCGPSPRTSAIVLFCPL